MVYPSPGFTFGTIVMVVKLNSAAAWFSLVEFENGAGALHGALIRHNGGQLAFNNGSTSLTAVAFSSSDGWAVIATTKATGTVAANNYKIPIGGATTTGATGTGANMFGSQVNMRFGGNDDFSAMYLAAVGIFNGVVLSQAQLEGIEAALSTQSIADLSPTALYDDSDAFATNLINPGTFDRSSLVGTTDSADDPSGWVFGLGGGGTAHEQDVNDAIAGTDAITKRVTRPSADTAALTDAVSKAPVHPLTDTAALTDATAKSATHPVADTGTLTDQVNAGGSVAHTHQIDDTIAGIDSIAKAAAHTLADTITGTDSRSSTTSLTVADTASAADSLSRQWVAVWQITDTLTITDGRSINWSGATRPWTYNGTPTTTYGGTATFSYGNTDLWTYEPVTG